MEILCLFAGVAFFYFHSPYPLLLLAGTCYFQKNWVVLLWFLAGIFWCCCHHIWQKDEHMPQRLVIQSAIIQGQILSIPAESADKTQFEFLVSSLDSQPAKARVLLHCYNRCPSFQMGETWRFAVKLKRPRNLANPGSFDYEGWLNARHIHWTGYIKARDMTLISPSEKGLNLMNLRDKLSKKLQERIADDDVLGIVQALTLGLTKNIASPLWDLFRRTGTTHLMVISGAHIGLVAGFAFALCQGLWRLYPKLCLRYPAIQVASIIGFITASAYALLAGFGIPAQRALVACLFLPLRYLLNQRFTLWQAWRYGLLLVLLYEPHAVFFPGFYFSFLAVAILMAANQVLSCRGIKKIIYLQMACLFGLMPLTLYWFSYGALIGLLANVFAIPLVGYVIVPLSLTTLIAIHLTSWPLIMKPLVWTTKILLWFLKGVDSFSVYNLQYSLSQPLSILALLLAMGLLLFFPVKAAWPAIGIMLLAALMPAFARPSEGEAFVRVLDVGQGLAVVVETHKHVLIYDTGVKYYHGNDMGQMAVIPYLKSKGISHIDKVVISHPDLDHRGGLGSLEKAYAIPELLVDKVSFYHRGKNCHDYPSWEWDGIQFGFLSIKPMFATRNNSSCVLKIRNAQGSILLTGDIEKEAENYLIKTYPGQLRSTLLVIPHHGSKTSSSPDFIKQVAPQYALISAGFDNRFHFPHTQTLKTLNKAKVKILDTIHCGMISIHLSAKEERIKPVCYIGD